MIRICSCTGTLIGNHPKNTPTHHTLYKDQRNSYCTILFCFLNTTWPHAETVLWMWEIELTWFTLYISNLRSWKTAYLHHYSSLKNTIKTTSLLCMPKKNGPSPTLSILVLAFSLPVSFFDLFGDPCLFSTLSSGHDCDLERRHWGARQPNDPESPRARQRFAKTECSNGSC